MYKKGDKLIIHCPTSAEWDKVDEITAEAGVDWNYVNKGINSWNHYRTQSAIWVDLHKGYSNYQWFKENVNFKSHRFLTAEEFIRENNSNEMKEKFANCRGAKLIEVLAVEANEGAGTPEDPLRRVLYLYSKNGKLLAQTKDAERLYKENDFMILEDIIK